MTVASSTPTRSTGGTAQVELVDPPAGPARKPDPRDVNQPQAQQLSPFELADRRLIDAAQRFQGSLRQSGPASHREGFGTNSTELVHHFGP
jgi:hypothetical protein